VSPYIVIVEFRVKPGARRAFRALIDENARSSARLEPGCRRFDVVELGDSDGTIFLYEIYSDRAAFDAHVASAHFKRFDASSAEHVISKTVRTGDLVCEGSASDST
jgi:autoinducer 2-degrading protein